MNALLATLMPAQPAGSRTTDPLAAASPRVASAAVEAAPMAAGLLAAAMPQAAVLPLFVDALRAVAADEAQPMPAQEIVDALPELATTEPGLIALTAQAAAEPARTALVQGFAAPAVAAVSSASDAGGTARPNMALRIAGAVSLSAAPATPRPVAEGAPAPVAMQAPAVRTGADAPARPDAAAPVALPERQSPQPAAAAQPVQAPAAGAAPAPATETAVLKLPNGAPEQWRQPLAQALGERLHVEVSRGSERAVIRLDPPMMGSVEIVIRHEGGNLQVHLSATHSEVLRQLQSIGDSLRQDLASRQSGDVSVQVSDGSRDADGRQRQRPGAEREDEPGRALAEAETGHDPLAFTLASERE